MGQQVNVYRELKFFPGAIITGTPGLGEGKTYYVNNITGSSTADGLSWNSAMSEPSYAITAVVAQQALAASGNEYIRHKIIIQGTSTAYAALTSLAGYTDYIGIGADPSGNGGGIARIDGAGVADAIDTSATTVRGVNLYNLQCMQSVAGSVYGLDVAGAMYRSRIEHCGFTNNGGAGIHVVKGGSIIIDDCQTIQDQFNSTYGMHIGSTLGGFNACKVTNSMFHGTTAAVLFATNNASDTWFHDCLFMGGTYGFQDTGAGASSDAYYPSVSHCFARGTTGNSIGNGGFVVTTSANSRFFDCIDSSGTASFAFPALS